MNRTTKTSLLLGVVALGMLSACSDNPSTQRSSAPAPVVVVPNYADGTWVVTEKDADLAKTKPVCDTPKATVPSPSTSRPTTPGKKSAPTRTKAPSPSTTTSKKLDLQKQKPSTRSTTKKSALQGSTTIHYALVARTTSCTTKTVFPADWDITIRNTKTGATEEIEVSKAKFDSYYIGQVYRG